MLLISELRESLTRVGADLKQRIVESVKSTWHTIHEFAMAHRGAEKNVEEEVDNVLKEMAKAEEEKAETACKTMTLYIYTYHCF